MARNHMIRQKVRLEYHNQEPHLRCLEYTDTTKFLETSITHLVKIKDATAESSYGYHRLRKSPTKHTNLVYECSDYMAFSPTLAARLMEVDV